MSYMIHKMTYYEFIMTSIIVNNKVLTRHSEKKY